MVEFLINLPVDPSHQILEWLIDTVGYDWEGRSVYRFGDKDKNIHVILELEESSAALFRLKFSEIPYYTDDIKVSPVYFVDYKKYRRLPSCCDIWIYPPNTTS